MLLRDRAGERALLSLEGTLLLGREGGRVVAGDGPLLETLGLSGRAGAAVRSGLHNTDVKTCKGALCTTQIYRCAHTSCRETGAAD